MLCNQGRDERMKGVLSRRMDRCRGDVSIAACVIDATRKTVVPVWGVVRVWRRRAELAWTWMWWTFGVVLGRVAVEWIGVCCGCVRARLMERVEFWECWWVGWICLLGLGYGYGLSELRMTGWGQSVMWWQMMECSKDTEERAEAVWVEGPG